MPGPRRIPLPDAWRAVVGGFIEYKTAEGLAQATLDTRRRQLSRFARGAGVPPAEIGEKHIVAALAACKSQATRRGLRNCLTTFLDWAGAHGHCKPGLSGLVPRVRTPGPHPRPCPDDYIADALGRASEAERLMLLLGGEYGLRRGEIACVHHDDVVAGDGGGWALIVHGKGGKQRAVPIRDDMAETIRGAAGYLFPGRCGGHVSPSTVTHHVGRLLPDGYGAHKLRARFATAAYAATHDMLGVSRALGHSSTAVTEHYIALPAESLCSVVNAAGLSAEARAQRPPARSDDAKPPRRANGDIRYPYDGTHGRVRAGTTREAIYCALLLCCEFGDIAATGGGAFDIPAESFAQWHSVGADGHARRSSPLRAAARRLRDIQFIELDDDHHGRIRGRVKATPSMFFTVMELLLGDLHDQDKTNG